MFTLLEDWNSQVLVPPIMLVLLDQKSINDGNELNN